MKKLILSIAAMLMIGMATVYAQSDTLSNTSSAKPKPQKPTTYQTQVPKGYMNMKSDDLPASLRTTLRGEEYTGWEQGTFYQNRTDNQYLVRIGTGNDTKSYYFDRNGQRVKDPGIKE